MCSGTRIDILGVSETQFANGGEIVGNFDELDVRTFGPDAQRVDIVDLIVARTAGWLWPELP